MSALSNGVKDQLLNTLCDGATFTPPAATYLRLYTVAVDDDGAGGTEIAGSIGYSPVLIHPSSSGSSPRWTAAATDGGTRMKTFNADIEIQASGGNFGNVVHAALWSASSGGTMIAHEDLATPQNISDGQILRIVAGSLKFRAA
jgi:hypothetical protein